MTNPKNKDDKSVNGASEKSEEGARSQGKNRKNSGRREEVCVEWIKNLQELESESNMEPEQDLSDDEVPEFCSNKTCPISEHKITKTPKVLKQAKKVILRKALFDNDDERWYCLKCLKAHNDSLFCFYCGQIYFMDESDLEDDGKAWICCDKCDKWVSCIINTMSEHRIYRLLYRSTWNETSTRARTPCYRKITETRTSHMLVQNAESQRSKDADTSRRLGRGAECR